MRLKFAFLFSCLLIIGLMGCESGVTREGDQFFKEGRYQEAIDAYTEYLTTRPKDIKTLYNRGRAFEELGQAEKSRADFNAILDLDEDNLNANLSMGKYWYNKKDFNRAINFFDKVIAVDGRIVDAYLLKGRSYHQKGDFSEAMKGYNQAIGIDNKNENAFLYRGALKVALNQRKSACNDLFRAKALGSEEADAALTRHCK